MAVTPNSVVTPQTPVSFAAVATTGETAFHNPTGMVTLVDETTDNVNGLRLTSIYAIMRATAGAAINCQLYRKVGTTYTLIDSVLMAANAPSATVANGKADFGYSETNPLILKAGVGLAVAIGTTTANGVTFAARGGAY
jgi:hypothetical protein